MRTMLITLILSFPDENETAAKRARAIVELAIEAKGGKGLLMGFPAWRFKYRERFVRNGKETIEVGSAYEWLARRQVRYEIDPDEIITMNGKEGWALRKGKVTSLTAGQLADFHEYQRGKEAMLTLLPLLTAEWRLSHRGTKHVLGTETDVIQITRKDGWKATTYWDRQTHLLAKAEYPHKKLLEPDDAKRTPSLRESTFGGYRRIKGIMFHTTLQAFSAGQRLGNVELTEIEILEALPESLFRKPR